MTLVVLVVDIELVNIGNDDDDDTSSSLMSYPNPLPSRKRIPGEFTDQVRA